jgi:hypothetical protein
MFVGIRYVCVISCVGFGRKNKTPIIILYV